MGLVLATLSQQHVAHESKSLVQSSPMRAASAVQHCTGPLDMPHTRWPPCPLYACAETRALLDAACAAAVTLHAQPQALGFSAQVAGFHGPCASHALAASRGSCVQVTCAEKPHACGFSSAALHWPTGCAAHYMAPMSTLCACRDQGSSRCSQCSCSHAACKAASSGLLCTKDWRPWALC